MWSRAKGAAPGDLATDWIAKQPGHGLTPGSTQHAPLRKPLNAAAAQQG